MTEKKVFVLEDTPLRTLLEAVLTQPNFVVISAGTPEEGRALAELYWKELDVAVLDMRLVEDANDDPSIPTGADIAIEVSRKINSFPPEILIYSDKDYINFYRTSLELGVAAYLLKNNSGVEVVRRHVRALALRRGLNVQNPAIASELNQIVVHSSTKPEAILNFCTGILQRELTACLGMPFVVLFTANNKTQICAQAVREKLQVENDVYHTIQALAHGQGNITEPFVLESLKLDKPKTSDTEKVLEILDQAAFLPLALSSDLKLSIGILRDNDSPSESKLLCNVLGQYLRATVFENVVNIWSQWTEIHATRTSIVKWCTLLGQEIKDSDSDRLETLANDLTNTGQLLHELEGGGPQEKQLISGPKILAEIWEQVEDSSQMQFESSGDCLLLAQKPDLEFIFSRLLQWFVWRAKTMPLDVKPAIRIACEASERDATITFEDNSHRLPLTLREDLFAPFTQAVSIPFPQLDGAKKKSRKSGTRKSKPNIDLGTYFPLYLVKMLVEGRYHGLLKDQSDEITEHPYGHRIVMQLPAA